MRGVPPDYYVRLHAAEQRHWWSIGMRRIGAALLAGHLQGSLVDVGCGTGGTLAWADGLRAFDRLCGVDSSAEAVETTRRLVPSADVRVATARELPFEDGGFDLAILADVLQHLHESDVEPSLRELRRVLRPTGALLVRTNGGRRAGRVRDDWRLYDARSLGEELRRGGFSVVRLTHANAALSLVGREPAPPTRSTCGIPASTDRVRSAVGSTLLSLEARYLRGSSRSLPFGHTLFALALPT